VNAWSAALPWVGRPRACGGLMNWVVVWGICFSDRLRLHFSWWCWKVRLSPFWASGIEFSFGSEGLLVACGWIRAALMWRFC
jgi:hypothetical protein